MKCSVLLIVSMLLISISAVADGAVEEEVFERIVVNTGDIPAPEDIEISKDGDDVILSWQAIEDIGDYKVYRSHNIHDEFPNGWEYEVVDTSTWRHQGVLQGDKNYFYLVRGVSNDIEGPLSNTAFCVAKHFVDDAVGRLHHVSLPARFNNLEEVRASDIVKDIEGSLDTSDKIESVLGWDYTVRAWDRTFYHINGNGWSGGEDFAISPGDGVGIVVRNDSDFMWHICGVEEAYTMDFVDDSFQNLHYISIPYTLYGNAGDGLVYASDIVIDIEGHLGAGADENINMVVKWDYTGGGWSYHFSYRTFPFQEWSGGVDFPIHPGEGIGLIISSEADFTWIPTLTSHHPPYVEEVLPASKVVALNSSITITFSSAMNRTSVEESLNWDGLLIDMEWLDDCRLQLQPQTKLEPGSLQTVTISSQAEDLFGNTLDGDGDGLPGGDFVYDFMAELPPEISHTPTGRWHHGDDIILEAVVTDDIELASVHLNYTFNTQATNMSMDYIGNDTYTATIPAVGTNGTLEYAIYAVDASGLIAVSGVHTIDLLDLTPTTMRISQEDTFMALNSTLGIEFTNPMMQDIRSAIVVEPEAHFELIWLDERTADMNFFGLDPDTEYEIFFNATEIKDINGISMEDNVTYRFTTQGYPVVGTVHFDGSVYKGSSIPVEVEISAYVEISSVQLIYNGTNGEQGIVLANNTVDNTWSASIPPQDLTGNINFHFKVEDVSGLVSISSLNEIYVANPSMVYPAEEIKAEGGKPFDLDIRVTNPVGVIQVIIHYTCSSGSTGTRELMLKSGDLSDGIWGCRMEFGAGEILYQLEVLDIHGESIILPSSPASVVIDESTSSSYLWLFILLAACAVTSGVFVWWKKRPEDNSSKATEEPEQLNNAPCTICFGNIEEADASHLCTDCDNRYHLSCISELGECPVCGSPPLAGVKDEET